MRQQQRTVLSPGLPLIQGIVTRQLCDDQWVVKNAHLLKSVAEFRRNKLVQSEIDGICVASDVSQLWRNVLDALLVSGPIVMP